MRQSLLAVTVAAAACTDPGGVGSQPDATFAALGPGPCEIGFNSSLPDSGVPPVFTAFLRPRYTYDEKGRATTVWFAGVGDPPWDVSYTSTEPCATAPPIVSGTELWQRPLFLHGCPSRLSPPLGSMDSTLKLSHDGEGRRLSVEQLPVATYFFKLTASFDWSAEGTLASQTARIDGNAAEAESWDVSYTKTDTGYRADGLYTCVAPSTCSGGHAFRETIETDTLGRIVHLVREADPVPEVGPSDVLFKYDCGLTCTSNADCPQSVDWSCADASIWGKQCRCTPTGPESCDGHDNDCDGVVDDGTSDCTQTGFACQNGTCACKPANLCGGSCVDIETDENNCGGCGVLCSGQCSAGRCATVIASGEGAPRILVTDGASLYWTTDAPPALRKMSTAGGAPVTLASFGRVWGLAVDATYLYFTVYENSSGSVGKVPKGGGQVSMIASGQSYPQGIAVDSSSVYWTNHTGGTVMRAPIDGGTPAMVASGQDHPIAIAVNATDAYFTNEYSGELMKLSLGGGAAVTFMAGTPFGGAVLLDASNVYWVSGLGMRKMPLAGGTPSNLVEGAPYIALDSMNLYGTSTGTPGPVLEVPLSGGPPKTLAATAHPAGIVVDATYVYWVNNGDGTVMKIAK